MEKNKVAPAFPKRKELSDTPVKFCNEISRLFRAEMRETEAIDGVMSQHSARLVLAVLVAGDGVIQQELVNCTHLKAPTVSVILQKMEKEGMVVRRTDPDDQRHIRVYLTDKGRRVDAEIISKIKQIDQVALSGLTIEEIDCLMLLLRKIRDNLLPQMPNGSGETE